MPPFKSPTPRHTYRIATEKSAITRHFRKRGVPRSTKRRLLLASWNVANLGNQKRTEGALQLIAHVLKRFDLIAVQEVNDEFRAFLKVVRYAGRDFDYVMTDTAGNNERLAYMYRRSKVRPTNLSGELALRERHFPTRTVSVRYSVRGEPRVDRIRTRFSPFDRNPFIGSFRSGNLDFTLVNCHLYFGSFQNTGNPALRKKYARRVLEIVALAKWAEGRYNKTTTYDRRIILLGDMNVPVMDPSESTYKELLRYGWQPLDYVSRTAGSNLGNDKTYDQMTFAPGPIAGRIMQFGAFDFDGAIFKSLWRRVNGELSRSRAISLFNRHVKHHVSDHRPLWVELDVS